MAHYLPHTMPVMRYLEELGERFVVQSFGSLSRMLQANSPIAAHCHAGSAWRVQPVGLSAERHLHRAGMGVWCASHELGHVTEH